MAGNDTGIRVSVETWKRLNRWKEPGESFDDVLNRILDETGGPAEPAATTSK